MTVAELIKRLRAIDPNAEVRLEASFDGMIGSGELSRIEVGDGVVVLGDEETGA